MLGSVLSDDVDDPNVEQVYKELERLDFLYIRSAPQETFMEVLPHHWFFPELQGLPVAQLGVPIMFSGGILCT
jgi:hypothetical protein